MKEDSNISVEACIYQQQIWRGRADTETEENVRARLQN